MARMIPKLTVLFSVFVAVLYGDLQATPQRQTEASVPDGFPLSAWLNQKEIDQVWWNVSVGKPYFRADLRQELTVHARFETKDTVTGGETHDIVMFARALENGRAIGPVHSVSLLEEQRRYEELDQKAMERRSRTRHFGLTMFAIVRPGKYRLELALLDRTTGRYNTKFENVTVEGPKNDPLQSAFQEFSKFEFFVPQVEREERPLAEQNISITPLGLSLKIRKQFTRLQTWSNGASADLPTFVINRPRPMHLSIIALLTPPEGVIDEALFTYEFQESLNNILTPVTRLRVTDGSARLTGIDLTERKRVFDNQDLREVSPDSLRAAIRRDLTTTTLSSMAGMTGNARFVTDLLKESFTRAETDTSGAEHTFIVVGARTALGKDSIASLPANPCRCKVHYIRFFVDYGRDDIEKLLINYKPQLYEPRSWPEFREQFARIYEQLQLQN